jgi:glycosyltransferase involved in cell wall biosynthesis
MGTDSIGYNEQRNFAYFEGPEFIAAEVPDVFDVLRKVWHRLTGIGCSGLLHSFALPFNYSVAGFHYFNKILLRADPWVVTYETTLPRYPELPRPLLRFALSRLAAPNCRAILAISECASQRFSKDLAENRAGLSHPCRDAIKSKLRTLHPPQRLLCTFEEKLLNWGFDGPLRLVLVGNDFYRKGGLELLIAVEGLLRRGLQIELTIAGRMVAGDYASRAGPEEAAKAGEIIRRHPGRIRAVGEVRNEQVVMLLKQAHVLCLPTWGDTYGYSVLEGQAACCAAITTDVRALPEINNEQCGWVITVPKLSRGDAAIGTREERKAYHALLVEGLLRTLSEAHDSRSMLQAKAAQAVERIRRHHSPDEHRRALEEIYLAGFR